MTTQETIEDKMYGFLQEAASYQKPKTDGFAMKILPKSLHDKLFCSYSFGVPQAPEQAALYVHIPTGPTPPEPRSAEAYIEKEHYYVL